VIISTGFAYVEPKTASTSPILDDLTRKATALLRKCRHSQYWSHGVHSCTGKNCAAVSDNKDHFLPDGRKTHSLLVHYVACHRRAVPEDDLAYIDSLVDEAQPTNSELFGTWNPAPSGRQPIERTPEIPRKSGRTLQREIERALAEKPRTAQRFKVIDTFEDPGNALIYEVSMDTGSLPGDPDRFVVTTRYLSDGQATGAEPLRFLSLGRAVATARSLAQKTMLRHPAPR
jgi:hypothetical protein